MPRLYEDVKKRLAIIENMYDAIRIVEPNNKEIISIKGDQIDKLNGSCYDYWKKGMVCSNCISSKSYNEDVVFAKIEDNYNNPIILIAIPIIINKDKYVVELLKSIGKREKIFEINNDEKIITDEIIDLFNIFYETEIKNIKTEMEGDFIKISHDKISALENKIDELRINLNKMCEMPDKIGKDNEILDMSQALDELIVEYMKGKLRQ
ncbi:aspartyl-phosphate phosphatase Spo0E family protein [Clostridium sp. JS66]|uniref:aspartyl-phosphate phosphatase Spo0E family protein n=1 Tax=Clostridium sp. JS66 TaxID=3064705 RepID=UPI00298DF968|nr:aspartyl-phosphate phosphatase Spo0E family protein [Clostridium sp. JS66]WPC42852.1 aspartyl-phosphate phosphatase Spo0E family protein [Clostridium sp. JS66]